ncbi:Hypothetical predicted protein [Mytilus galloprovincialis]|uniref:C-type lectin domain-containing protein n=1 Tax=Mytilus galloprovincialis TaxID=29158 RepID=A0A8B6F979_MYTGA|nr:Hypothetical predicted protein [Mytilus galloprovincialis]
MGMTSPSTTTAVNCNCQCDVTLPPTTQSSPTTTTNTPCVPTSCPPEYMLLPDENVSPNCYLYSGNENRKSWDEARRTCSMTPGAFLWNANTKKEAVASVRDQPFRLIIDRMLEIDIQLIIVRVCRDLPFRLIIDRVLEINHSD